MGMVRTSLACGALGATILLHGCFVSVDEFPVGSEIGSACNADMPCALGLECWQEDAVPLGPAGGLCTMPCTKDGDCPVEAACVELAQRSACVLRCDHGDGDAAKCRARRDVGCVSPLLGPSGEEVCVPRCADDADCAPRFCDRVSGYCDDTPSGGDQPGTYCGDVANCSGECTGPGAGDSKICTERCVIGAAHACASLPGWTLTSVCIDAGNSDAKIGDVGFCSAECSCNSDCPGGIINCVLESDGRRYCSVKLGGTPCG
jgi:hypothetical protein